MRNKLEAGNNLNLEREFDGLDKKTIEAIVTYANLPPNEREVFDEIYKPLATAIDNEYSPFKKKIVPKDIKHDKNDSKLITHYIAYVTHKDRLKCILLV